MVCHGTVTRRLGLDTAIEALALVRGRLPDVRLRVIGAGDYLGEIKALTPAGWTSESDGQFRGSGADSSTARQIVGSDVGLVPNHATNATQLMLPVKLLEFATLGIPVIAARLRTIEHYFGDDAVRYFTPGNSRELAQAIEDLYFDPDCRAGAGAARRGGGQGPELARPIAALLPGDRFAVRPSQGATQCINKRKPWSSASERSAARWRRCSNSAGPVLNHDIEPREFDDPIGVMHLCIPFTRPEPVRGNRTLLHRALQSGADDRQQHGDTRNDALARAARGARVAYSPVRGKHVRMAEDLLRYNKFVAA